MSKFEIGQKVRIKQQVDYPKGYEGAIMEADEWTRGKVGVIVDFDNSYTFSMADYTVRFDDDTEDCMDEIWVEAI